MEGKNEKVHERKGRRRNSFALHNASRYNDCEPEHSLLDRVALIADLEELLGREVDVVTEAGIYWLLRRKILKEAERIAAYTDGGKAAFLTDKRTQGAVARNFQIIGEAAKRMTSVQLR